MATITVVIALEPPSLARVAEHLLRPRHGARVVERAREAGSLPAVLRRTRPDLVFVNSRFLGRELASALAELRRSSPDSKLVLVSPAVRGADRTCSVDAVVDEEVLVHRLLPLVRKLAGGDAASRAATAPDDERRGPKPKEPEDR